VPDDGYRYDVDQCDVPEERRPALSRFREKRREWLSWLDTDEHHAIWPTVHDMVWTDVAFSALREVAEENDENALNNPLIVEALLKGHLATQVLAIRRLMEDTPKERLSLRRLVTDLKRHRALFTRESYVCHDGLPYDYEAVRDARFSKLAAEAGNTAFFMWGATEGPEADGASEIMHHQFDKSQASSLRREPEKTASRFAFSRPLRRGSTTPARMLWQNGAAPIWRMQAVQANGRGSTTWW
jgi:hypothetical protein